jgi:hypothetical protein
LQQAVAKMARGEVLRDAKSTHHAATTGRVGASTSEDFVHVESSSDHRLDYLGSSARGAFGG